MNILSITTTLASRVGALLSTLVNYQRRLPINSFFTWPERALTALTSPSTSTGQLTRFVSQTFAGKYVLGFPDDIVSDKVEYTWLGPSSQISNPEPIKRLPVYLAIVFPRGPPATPTLCLFFPPTPAVEVQFQSAFAIFLTLSICISVTSMLTLCIIRRRLNIESRSEGNPITQTDYPWLRWIVGFVMVGLASSQRYIVLGWDLGRAHMRSDDVNTQNDYVFYQGTSEPSPACSVEEWDGVFFRFFSDSPPPFGVMTPDTTEFTSSRRFHSRGSCSVEHPAEGQAVDEPRTLRSALKKGTKPLRDVNVHFSKAYGQVFLIPHRLDNLWERDTVVIVPRINGLLRDPDAESRGYCARFSETVAVRHIQPRTKIAWETQPWHDAFWNDS